MRLYAKFSVYNPNAEPNRAELRVAMKKKVLHDLVEKILRRAVKVNGRGDIDDLDYADLPILITQDTPIGMTPSREDPLTATIDCHIFMTDKEVHDLAWQLVRGGSL